MGLAKKLMLVYSIVLGITITVFAGQLTKNANLVTETAFLKDTQRLIKESKHEIDRKIDVCYRAIVSISSDYDLMNYVRTWSIDNTSIFDFRLDLEKRMQLIRDLVPELHQIRIFVTKKDFPEISPVLYHISRVNELDSIIKGMEQPGASYWLLNHLEENYSLNTANTRNVVSLYKLLKNPKDGNVALAEVTMLSETFFRPIYSQAEKKNLLPCIIDKNNHILYDADSSFISKYELDHKDLEQIFKGMDLKGKSGTLPVTIHKIGMNLVYDYIPTIDCSVCYIVSNDDIMTSINKTRNLIIFESMIALIVMCFFIYFITRIILKKMRQIIASMRKVQEGVLDIRVDIKGQDEMGEMAYHFNKMLKKIQELISVVIKKQEANKNAEIRSLFTQINSHFLINVLENIRMIAEVDYNYQVADSIASLGKLLRYGLKWTKEYVNLSEEIEYIKNYIKLVNMRYDYEVKLDIQIPDEHMNHEVLKMSLQPIIENAVYHGIEPLGRDGALTIGSYVRDSDFYVEVTDNGVGMDEERLELIRQNMRSGLALEVEEKKGNGIGLRNINERIMIFYGDEYGLDIVSKRGAYTRVTMKLPFI